MFIIFWILIGALAGFFASQLVNKTGEGFLLDLLLGIIGSVIGGLLFGALGIVAIGPIGSLVTATAGAVVFLLLLRAVRGARRTPHARA